MQRVTSATSHPLFSVATTREIDKQLATTLPTHSLMHRAGLAVARLTLALAPHAQRIWIACGPGNNGGDGFEAALHLHQRGKAVTVTWTGPAPGKTALPPDAQTSFERAMAAGVLLTEHPPADFDFCIDALLGIGAKLDKNYNNQRMQTWLALLRTGKAPCLAIDVPSGLDADNGHAIDSVGNHAACVGAADFFTLSLLTLKPGLFTAWGRDLAGEVWFDDLGMAAANLPVTTQACAHLLGQDCVTPSSRALASHASHKGSFGDVAIIGGEFTSTTSHMTGAALLAARAALHAGAGRVYIALMGTGGHDTLTLDTAQAELMFRSPSELNLKTLTVVCGCGGGDAVRAILPQVLSTAPRLVLDADALNALAADTSLQVLLQAREGKHYQTILTPHPLEAARLASLTTANVQASRLSVAALLAQTFKAVVVLKGSGTVIAAPGRTSCINSTGNALLATAGTGDVLAGMAGARLANGIQAFEAACSAVFTHGRYADDWRTRHAGHSFVASRLLA